ncbi:MAG: glycosyltransferase family 2 protein, partial [Microcystis panniformis]
FGRGGERLVRGLLKSVTFINDPTKSFDNLLYAYGQIGYLSEAVKAMLTPQK